MLRASPSRRRFGAVVFAVLLFALFPSLVARGEDLEIRAAGVVAGSIDGSDLAATITLNETKTVVHGAYDWVHNLNSTGDLVVHDNGAPFATFADTGTLSVAHPTSLTTGNGISVSWIGATTQGAATLAALDIDGTNVTTATGRYFYGLHVNDATGTNGTSYGAYVEGGNWDYGLYVETAAGLVGGLLTAAGNLTVGNGATSAGVLQINEDTDDGTNNATFTVPALAADTDYTLPTTDGAASEFLQTDGAGVLTWAAGTTYTAGDGLTLTGADFDLDASLTTVSSMNFASGGTITATGMSHSPGSGANGVLLDVGGTLVENGAAGTHARLSGMELAIPTVTAGTHNVTNAQTLYIAGAPSASGATNAALWVDAGTVQIDGDLSLTSTGAAGWANSQFFSTAVPSSVGCAAGVCVAAAIRQGFSANYLVTGAGNDIEYVGMAALVSSNDGTITGNAITGMLSSPAYYGAADSLDYMNGFKARIRTLAGTSTVAVGSGYTWEDADSTGIITNLYGLRGPRLTGGDTLNRAIDLDPNQGTTFQIAAESALTLTADAVLLDVDASTNMGTGGSGSSVGYSVTGIQTATPAVTNVGTGTYNYRGLVVTSGAVVQNTGAGTDAWRGLDVTMPAITQTTGAVTAYGVAVTGGAVTSGTEAGVYVNMNAAADTALHVDQGIVQFDGALTVAPAASTSGVPTLLTLTGAAHTGLTAATEDVGANLNFSATKTWAAGAGPLANQREVYIQAPTYVGDAGGALTITDAYTLYVSGAPTQGANMTLTRPWAAGFNGNIGVGDGTVTLPSLAFISDPNTGLFLGGTDRLSITAGGSSVAQFETDRIQFQTTDGLTIVQRNQNTPEPILTLTPYAVANSDASTERTHFSVAAATQTWNTGALTTQRYTVFDGSTSAFVLGSLVSNLTNVFVDTPNTGTNATVTTLNALQVGGAATINQVAGTVYGAIGIPAHTITLGNTTQITSSGMSGLSIGQVTLTQAGATTVDNFASLYVAGAGVAGGSAVITNNYALWADGGTVRFDEHLNSSGDTPSGGASGASYAFGSFVTGASDAKGSFSATLGTGGSAGTITVTFAVAYERAPVCVFSAGDADAATFIGAGNVFTTVSTTILTFNISNGAGEVAVFNYHCIE